MTQKRNLNVVNVLANTFKFATCAVMVMLLTALTSCNGEQEILLPSNATALLTTEIDSTMTLGHTEAWWSGSAKTADAVLIDGSGRLVYDAMPKIYVAQLGLPTNVTGNNTGTVFTSSDGQVFNRSFNWSSTTGVNGTSTPSWLRTVILAQLNDSTELVEAQFNEAWEVSTSLLPTSVISRRADNAIIRVLYQRVVKPEAPKPVAAQYRLRIEFIENDGNNSYWKAFGEKSTDGGITWTIEEQVDEFCALTCGNLKPQINGAKLVSSYSFAPSEEAKPLEASQPRPNEGIARSMEIRNTIATDNIWGDTFDAPADANGNAKLLISGA